MQDSIGIAFIAVAIAQVVGTIVYLVNAGRLFRCLAQRHKVVHESIGSPLLIMNNTPRNSILFLRWIWNRDFLELSDPQSVALARLVRALLVFLLGGFAVLIALFLVLAATP